MSTEDDVRTLLRRRGAETIAHPGGTLYAHLLRVHDRLAGLGSSTKVQLAGLAHAVYGTDGFDVVLLNLTERAILRDLVGDDAETLVYRYGACDRRRTWQNLGQTHEVWDRFTNQVDKLTAAELRPFVDLSIINEIDVIEHSPTIAEKYGAYFRALFRSWTQLASDEVTADARQSVTR